MGKNYELKIIQNYKDIVESEKAGKTVIIKKNELIIVPEERAKILLEANIAEIHAIYNTIEPVVDENKEVKPKKRKRKEV